MKPKKLIKKKSAWDVMPWEDDVILVDASEDAPLPHTNASVVGSTLADLREAFDDFGHNPAVSMWAAIEDIARTIDDMANGRLKPLFYSSALDPGVGKTQTIVHSIRNLRTDAGVLICLSRIDEVNNLVKAMQLSSSEFAVLIGARNEFRIDDFGNKDHNAARVLFATQQKVDTYLKAGVKFQELADFYFNGKPRVVKIWDESLLPGKEITLNIHDIAGTQKTISTASPPLANMLSDMQSAIKLIADGEIYQVPDFEGFSQAFRSLRLQSHPKLDRELVDDLWTLSGKAVRVRHDRKGNTVLDYTESLPNDFAPVLILDASARVRTTYRLWQEKRGNLIELRNAHKQYRDLTIHHWNRGGGKRAFSDERMRAELVEGIASAINSKPSEEWLVIIHKGESERLLDIRGLIEALITNKEQRVHFLTWGNHHATNQYVRVKNVILAGTLFYPESTYEVRGRAASALRTDQELSPRELRNVKLGEYAHLILQALCRGSVRICVNDSCALMDAYIIAAAKTGIPDHLRTIFPGCDIKEWEPVERPLEGKLGDAVLYLKGCFAERPGMPVSFQQVQEHLGIRDRSNFNKLIRNDPRFKRELERIDVYESGNGRYNTYFERVRGVDDLPAWA